MTSLTGNNLFPPRRWEKAEGAFLLFEVMVAVAVLAFALTYILGSFTTALRGLTRSQNYHKSLSLLEEKLCEIEKAAIKEGGISEEEDSGEFKGNENFRWELESRKIEDLPLNELKLKVSWLEGGKERNITLLHLVGAIPHLRGAEGAER